MGVAIIGGLLFGTGLTLYVVPAVYSYLTREITAEERALHAGDKVVAQPTR
jgi:multidrug efflux pump